jgi:hypothetical protein
MIAVIVVIASRIPSVIRDMPHLQSLRIGEQRSKLQQAGLSPVRHFSAKKQTGRKQARFQKTRAGVPEFLPVPGPCVYQPDSIWPCLVAS